VLGRLTWNFPLSSAVISSTEASPILVSLTTEGVSAAARCCWLGAAVLTALAPRTTARAAASVTRWMRARRGVGPAAACADGGGGGGEAAGSGASAADRRLEALRVSMAGVSRSAFPGEATQEFKNVWDDTPVPEQ
jgi:hypothetical protein